MLKLSSEKCRLLHASCVHTMPQLVDETHSRLNVIHGARLLHTRKMHIMSVTVSCFSSQTCYSVVFALPRACASCLCRQCKETYSLIASWRERQHEIDTLCKGIQDNVLFNLSTQQSPLDVPLFADIQADHLQKVDCSSQMHITCCSSKQLVHDISIDMQHTNMQSAYQRVP